MQQQHHHRQQEQQQQQQQASSMQAKPSSQLLQQQQQNSPQPFDSYRHREQQQQQQLSSLRRSGSPSSAAALDAAQAEQQLSEQQQENCMTLVNWNPVQEPSWLPPYQVPAAQQQQAFSSRRQPLGQPNSSEQQVQQQQQPGGWGEQSVADFPCNTTHISYQRRHKCSRCKTSPACHVTAMHCVLLDELSLVGQCDSASVPAESLSTAAPATLSWLYLFVCRQCQQAAGPTIPARRPAAGQHGFS
jgi:hypothetical protein